MCFTGVFHVILKIYSFSENLGGFALRLYIKIQTSHLQASFSKTSLLWVGSLWHTSPLRFSFHIAALSLIVTTERRDAT